jgi:hypothetical protein
MPLVGQSEAAGVPQHVRVGLEAQLSSDTRGSTILAKPAVVKGAPRSLVKTKGDFGSCSRASFRSARSSSPLIGCVGREPFFTLRTASEQYRSRFDPTEDQQARSRVGRAYRQRGSSSRRGCPSGCPWPHRQAAPPLGISNRRRSPAFALRRWNCSIFGVRRYQTQNDFGSYQRATYGSGEPADPDFTIFP